MRKQRNHSFPKTYTTTGAVYRAKKNFQQRFPEYVFVIQKLTDKEYMLICPNLQEQMEHLPYQEVVMETQTQEIV